MATDQKTMKKNNQELPAVGKSIAGSSFFMLGLILLCAFAFRVFMIDVKSFWFDESAVSMYALRKSFLDLIAPEGFNHPGLFFLLLKSVMTFSLSPSVWRYISVFFGVGSVWLLFLIGRILYDQRVALLSSLLLALSALHVFYSQEVGVFSLFLFSSLLYVYTLIVIVRAKTVTVLMFAFFCFATVVMIFSHYFSFIVVLYTTLILFFVRAMREKRHVRRIFLIQGSVVLSSLICMIPFLNYFFFERGFLSLAWVKNVSLGEAFYSLLTSFSYGGQHFGGDDINVLLPSFGILPLLALFEIVLILVGLIMMGNKKSKQRAVTGAVFGWLVFPACVVVIFSSLFFPVFVVRHLLFLLPAFYVLIAVGVFAVPNKYWQMLCIFVLVFFSLMALTFYYKHELKTPWKTVMHYLEEAQIDHTDIIVLNPYFERSTLYTNMPSFEDYLQNKDQYWQVISPTMFKKMVQNGVARTYRLSQKRYRPLQSSSIVLNKKRRVVLIQSRFSNAFSYIFQGGSLLGGLQVRALFESGDHGSSPDPLETRRFFKSVCATVAERLIDHEGRVMPFPKKLMNDGSAVITGAYIAIGEINEDV